MELRHVFIWAIGAMVSNALMDVMTMVRFTLVKPTLYGVIYTYLHAYKLDVPKPYKWYNVYFSILFSWAMAAIALFALILIVVFRDNANNISE